MQSRSERRASGGDKRAEKGIVLLRHVEALLRRLPTKKNRAISLVVLAVVPLFVLFVGLRVLQGREQTARIRTQNEAIIEQIQALDAQTKEYLAVLGDEDPEAFRDYVIRIAREQLGLSLPGDQIFIDRSFVQSNQK